MKFLILLSFIGLATHQVASLHCYTCIGSLNGDCANGDESGMLKNDCSLPASYNVFPHALFVKEASPKNYAEYCITFNFHPVPGSEEAFARGCAITLEQDDPCQLLAEAMGGTNCSACQGELCNNN